MLAATEDAHARGEVFEGDYRMVAANGRTVWIRDQGAIVRDDDGRPLFAQGFLLDITSEREAREEQARLEDELRQAQKLEAIGRLAGGMAHDFNNLLTAIGGYSEFLIDGLADDDERRADAEEIKRAADRATDLTRQLLAFGRRQVLERQSLDLNEVVSELDKLLRRLIGTDIELVTVLAPALGCVEADRSQLEQVIVNLALNARDAMPDGGKLVLETQNLTLEGPLLDQSPSLEPGDYVTLSVRDTGVGIDADTQARMFEPFFTTKDVGRGTGLGLSTVYGIVEQSGGRVYVYSEPGLGTTFKIHLPQSDLPAPADDERPAEPTSFAGTETILLVEDEETLRQLAARTLRSQGYTVLEAHYASEALELWQAYRDEIDLVVTDVVMPGLSGVELAERIAAEDSGMRIVLMSGYADPGAGERVPESNRAGFLEKPFTPNSLLRTVREAVERA